MPFAVIMYFNAELEKTVRRIWDEMAAAGISTNCPVLEATPHLTLAMFDEADRDKLVEKAGSFAEKRKPIDVNFAYVGTFATDSYIMFLAPTMSRELMEIHEGLHDALFGMENSSELYAPEKWSPHCTLTQRLEPEMLGSVVDILKKYNLPIKGRLESLGIIEYPPIDELCILDLTRNE